MKPMDTSNAQPLWTVADVGRRFGCSDKHVYDLAREGKIPSVRIGHSLRFDPRAIDAFIARGGHNAAANQ